MRLNLERRHCFWVRMKNTGGDPDGYIWKLPNCPYSCLISWQAQIEPAFSFLFCKSGGQHQRNDEKQMLSLWGMNA